VLLCVSGSIFFRDTSGLIACFVSSCATVEWMSVSLIPIDFLWIFPDSRDLVGPPSWSVAFRTSNQSCFHVRCNQGDLTKAFGSIFLNKIDADHGQHKATCACPCS